MSEKIVLTLETWRRIEKVLERVEAMPAPTRQSFGFEGIRGRGGGGGGGNEGMGEHKGQLRQMVTDTEKGWDNLMSEA